MTVMEAVCTGCGNAPAAHGFDYKCAGYDLTIPGYPYDLIVQHTIEWSHIPEKGPEFYFLSCVDCGMTVEREGKRDSEAWAESHECAR